MIIITILVKQTQNKKVTLLYINKIIAKKTHCSVGKKKPNSAYFTSSDRLAGSPSESRVQSEEGLINP